MFIFVSEKLNLALFTWDLGFVPLHCFHSNLLTVTCKTRKCWIQENNQWHKLAEECNLRTWCYFVIFSIGICSWLLEESTENDLHPQTNITSQSNHVVVEVSQCMSVMRYWQIQPMCNQLLLLLEIVSQLSCLRLLYDNTAFHWKLT